MKFKPIITGALALICIGACQEKYDDTDLRNTIADLQKQVAAYESMASGLNGDISTLGNLVNTLSGNKFIKDVTQLEDGGYKITFTNGDPIILKDGKDGENGKQGA